jgi:hypothetical protein
MAAVILEGSMQRMTPPSDLAAPPVRGLQAEVRLRPPQAYTAGVWSLRPQRARAWSGFPTDATRFLFT